MKTDAKGRTPMPEFDMLPLETKGLPAWKQLWVMMTSSRRIRLRKNYVIFVKFLGIYIMAPAGFITNLASIPRWLWWLIPPDGIFMVASIFHDFFYQYRCLLTPSFRIICAGKSKNFGDNLFRKLNAQVNGMQILDGMATYALTAFGWIAWRRCRKENALVKNDYPKSHYFVEGKNDLSS